MTTEAERARDAGMPGDSKQIAIRVPKELLVRIERYTKELLRLAPGLRLSEAAVIKLLVEQALTAIESEKKKR